MNLPFMGMCISGNRAYDVRTLEEVDMTFTVSELNIVLENMRRLDTYEGKQLQTGSLLKQNVIDF